MDGTAEWAKRFQVEWYAAGSVDEVAVTLRTTVRIVLRVAALFRRAGCPLPFRPGVPITYECLTHDYEGVKYFITVWCESGSVFQVAACLGRSVGFVLRVAARLRQFGVQLDSLPRWSNTVVFGNN